MLKKILESYFFEFFIYLFRFASNIFLIRLLGPELNGQLSFLLAIIGLFNFINIFSSDVIIYSEAVKNNQSLKLIYNNNLIKIFFSFILIGSIFLFLNLIENDFNNIVLFILIIAEILRQVINNYFQIYLQALNKVKKYKFIDLIGYIILTLSFMAMYHYQLSDFLIIVLLILFKEFLVSCICIMLNKDIKFKLNFDLTSIKQSFDFGKYLVLPKITTALATNISVIILGSNGYFIEAGVISVLARLKMILLFPINAIEALIRRVYFRLKDESELNKLSNFNESYWNITSFYFCFLIVFMIINADFLTGLILGNDYLFISDFFMIYFFTVFINTISRVFTYIFHAKKNTKKLGNLNFIYELSLFITLIIVVPDEFMGIKLLGFGILGDLFSKFIFSLLLFTLMINYCLKKKYLIIKYKFLNIFFISLFYSLIYIIFGRSFDVMHNNIFFIIFMLLLFFAYYKFSFKYIKNGFELILKNEL